MTDNQIRQTIASLQKTYLENSKKPKNTLIFNPSNEKNLNYSEVFNKLSEGIKEYELAK